MKLLLACLLLTLNLKTWAQDQKESRLHQIYENYNSNPLSDERWKSLIGDRAKQYTIQKGDTLWGISLTFFGDGFYWPKIWSLNKEITNPHIIEPGNIISFWPGNIFTAPGMTIEGEKPNTPEGQPIETGPMAEVAPTKELSIEVNNSRPAQPIPPSLPEWNYAFFEDVTKDIQALPKKNVESDYKNEFLLEENEVSYAGEVIDVEAGGNLADTNQYVYVKLTDSYSKDLLAVTQIQTIKNGESPVRVMQILGQLSLGDLVNREENIFRAMVVDTTNGISKGAKIQSGVLSTYKPSNKEIVRDLPAQIVALPETQQNTLGSNNMVAFIDVGQERGAYPGMVLPIYQKRAFSQDGKLLANINLHPIGSMQVIQSTPHFSSVLILESRSEIRVGDQTSSSLSTIE